MNLKIQEINNSNLNNLLNIFLNTNIEYLPDDFHTIKDINSLQTWLQKQKDDNTDIFLITKDNNYIGIIISIDFNNQRHIGYIVSSEFQGQGFGKKILDKIIQKAKEDNIDTLYAGVNKHNKPSINILEYKNFIYDSSQNDEYIYILNLT